MRTTMRDTTKGTHQHPRISQEVAGWGAFAAMLLLLAGCSDLIFGLTAAFRGHVFVLVSPGTITGSLTGWGVVHLLFGLLLVGVSVGLFTGRWQLRPIAVWLAALNVVGQVAVITVFPLWALLVALMDILVIYALTTHWEELG
jgi:hypothetical protein